MNNDILIGVVGGREVMVLNHAAKAAVADSTGFVENGGFKSDIFVAELDGKVESSSSAKTTLSRGFVETGDGKAFKEAAANCVAVQGDVRD